MSKVFSAKRKSVKFDYEFLDGKGETLEVTSLSSKEQEEVAGIEVDSTSDVLDKFKTILLKQLHKNDKKIVEKIIDEQYEEGDLIEFSNSLSSLIHESKAKK
jgi:hypothetical protein